MQKPVNAFQSVGALLTPGILAYRQDIFERGLEEIFKLLLGNEFKEGGLQGVSPDVVKELHGRRGG